MTRSIGRRRFLAGTGGVALVATAGCGMVDRDERNSVARTYDPTAVDRVALDTETGDLAITGTPDGPFRVQGVKRGASQDAIDALSLDADRDGGQLRLETDVGNGPWPLGWWRTPQFPLEVEAPQSLHVERAETEHGDLDVEGVDGPITARTRTGDVYVAGVSGPVEAITDAGDVIVRNATGSIDARSETGDLTIDGVVAGLSSSTGDVVATVRGVDGAPSVEAEAGDVEVALARSLDVTVAAGTENGTVAVHGDGFASTDARTNSATVQLGDGTEDLTIASDAGDVSITTL